MAYRITFVGWDGSGIPPGIYPVFDVWDGPRRALRTSIALGEEKAFNLKHQLELQGRALDDAARVAVLRLGVRRLEEGIRSGFIALSGEQTRAYLNDEDVSFVLRLLTQKTCRYQTRLNTGLFCEAATADDGTVVGQIGLQRVAPTTQALCATCGLPDSDHVCAHLSHPDVRGLTAEGSVFKRILAGALCDLGRAEVADPSSCHAGGHGCWERMVEREDVAAKEVFSSTALASAFDHLDDAWRASLGVREHLVGRLPAEVLAGLAQPCNSRADMGERLNQLDTVMKRLDVPLQVEASTETTPGPLVRLRDNGANRLRAAGLDTEDVDNWIKAVESLRVVNRLRVAMEHPGMAKIGPEEAFARLGITWPPDDWGEAWKKVQAVTLAALDQLAALIRRVN